MGTTMALGCQAALTVVTQHFQQKHALVVVIACAGSAAGGVCFPIMFERLCPILGFPLTMRITALKVLYVA
jgi:MCP family monocarboxylic acid transporter-like MFS transporter 10